MRKLTIILSLFIGISCSGPQESLQRITGNAFGTTYSIQYYGHEGSVLKACIDSTITAVNQSLSTYISDSDISRINRGDSIIVVDNMFREVFELSRSVHEDSDGYFDPTVGLLRNAYGFGDSPPNAFLDSTALDSIMRFVGFHKVSLNPDGTVKKDHPKIYLDFNAVAKGYGIDRIADCLEALRVEHYLIELGGELLGKGRNVAKDKPWLVGIESPYSKLSERDFTDIVKLSDAGMASSGNYRKFRVDSLTGRKYVHTIDPLTGQALENDLTSATVIAPNCAMADAYATAFMAMGLTRSLELLESKSDVQAYFTYIDTTGTDQIHISPGFKLLLGQ